MTFDAWEAQIHHENDCLMHWGILGMKHGQRRYQNRDGTWTAAGLAARRQREGWGDSKKKRKAERTIARSERHAARKAARAAFLEKRQKNKLKNLSDDELQKRINRLKMEKEYKELNKNPMVEAGLKLINAYFASKEKKLKRESDKARLEVDRIRAVSELRKAKAAQTQAKNDFLDNSLHGKGYMKAKSDLIQTKAKNTVGGAIRSTLNSIITKEGRNIVKEMPDNSIVLKGAKKVTGGIKRAGKEIKEYGLAAYGVAGDEYLKRRRKGRQKLSSDYGLKG